MGGKMAAPVYLQQFSRLVLSRPLQQQTVRSIAIQNGPLLFQATHALCGEPLKKKKAADSAADRKKEQKKLKKIEKAIRNFEKAGRVLKPIDEIEGDRKIYRTREERVRKNPVLEFEECERRALLQNAWRHYKLIQVKKEMKAINLAMEYQQKALNELRAESEELYHQAVMLDDTLIPFERKGPLNTPPKEGYDPVDGEYTDTTNKFDRV